MGVFVSLKLMPQCIAPVAWSRAYDDTLALLKAWPQPLMSLKREKKYSVDRLVFSRDIEHEPDDPAKRHWLVVGDLASKESGESFTLYRDLAYYLPEWRRLPETGADSDILDDTVGDERVSIQAFCEKTQGHPYHFAILAAAMLIEARFPQHAQAGGDIDIHQAQRAQAMIQTSTGQAVALPICVDGPRLFQRMQRHFHGAEAVKNFEAAFRGEIGPAFDTLYAQCAGAFTDWFIAELRGYSSPGQLGVVALSMGWLGATGDLPGLCELACLREEGPKFDPVAFAEALASTWISLDESSRQVLNPFQKTPGETDTVMTQLGAAFFALGGLKGREMKFYLPEAGVLAVFTRLFPEQCERMERAFIAKTQSLKKDLEKSREGVEQLVNRAETEPEAGDGSSILTLVTFNQASSKQKLLLESVTYAVTRVRGKICTESPALLEGDAEQLRERMVRLTHQQGQILTEDAWNWLDKETDLKFLQYLVALVAIDYQELRFGNVRKGLLENRALCWTTFQLSDDPAFPARMEALLPAKSA